jgi:poly(A) polymerase
VKPLFRRAFIIGRRFRLVHVHVGNEVIEVSTFRAPQKADEATDEHGRLISDNVYGTQAEDAARRDFTINALYFDPTTEEVWDYVGGVADVRSRKLKLIGPPVTRFREDPVRMLRACASRPRSA